MFLGRVESRSMGRMLQVVFWAGVCMGIPVGGGSLACGGSGGAGQAKTKARAPAPTRESDTGKEGGEASAPGPQKARWQPEIKGEVPAESPPGKKRAGGAGLTGACDQYYRCCVDYATALGKVKSVPKSALQAAYKACGQVIKIQQQPSGQEICNKALEAMQKATGAFRKMPGFVPPPSCTGKTTP